MTPEPAGFWNEPGPLTERRKALAAALRALKSRIPEVAERVRTEADYFEGNAGRMRYRQFRRQHLFAGSGVIEAGCKTVVSARLKRPGMFWTVRGANAILALRFSYLNCRFEDYWEGRRAAIAAQFQLLSRAPLRQS